jgi:hypothetical protein
MPAFHLTCYPQLKMISERFDLLDGIDLTEQRQLQIHSQN